MVGAMSSTSTRLKANRALPGPSPVPGCWSVDEQDCAAWKVRKPLHMNKDYLRPSPFFSPCQEEVARRARRLVRRPKRSTHQHPGPMMRTWTSVMLFQWAAAQLPTATVWEFKFTDVRSHVGFETPGVQLAELYLKDASGNNLTVVSASNPGGDQSLNKDQTADKAVDGDLSNRWLDASIIKPDGTCCGESTLQLTLAEAAAVSSYQVRHFIKTT